MTEQEKIDMLNAARLLKDMCESEKLTCGQCPFAYDEWECLARVPKYWEIPDE